MPDRASKIDTRWKTATSHANREARPIKRLVIPSIGVLLAIAVTLADWWPLYDTAIALVFGWLIYRASSGFKGIVGRLLSAPPLVFLGRISYGIYVYHPLVPAAVVAIAATLGLSLPGGTWEKVILIGLTLLVSTVSWYSFERPLTNLKRHFR